MSDPAIWIDPRPAQDPEQGLRGIGRQVAEHTRALVSAGAVTGAVLSRAREVPEPLAWLEARPELRWVEEVGAEVPDVFHVMSAFEPRDPLDVVWPRFARVAPCRLVLTVHDLIPLALPELYLPTALHRTRYRARLELVRQADHVLAVSEVTAADVEKLAGVDPARISVIDAGVRVDHAEPADPAGRVPTPGFPLYVGGADARKNLERLVSAWGLVEPEIRAAAGPLAIVGHMPPDRIAGLRATAAEAGLREDELLLTGYVSDGELARFYRDCGLFVFPSYYEGSGLPLLEAMAHGAPVSAACVSTAPEILGDALGCFEPFDVPGMATALTEGLTNDALREQLVARSRERAGLYTWEHVAQRTAAGYERALTRPSRRASGRP